MANGRRHDFPLNMVKPQVKRTGRRRPMRRPLLRGVNHATAALVSIIMMLPIYLVVVNSLKDSVQARAMGVELPKGLHLDNYLTVIDEGKLGQAFTNSVLYTGLATILCILCATAAAFVLARNRTRLNRFWYFFLVMGIAIPLNYVTMTKVMQITHLVNSQLGMILLYAAFKLPFAVFVIYAFVHTVPREIDEAAVIDGCSPRQLFWSVMVPLLRPAWITVGILTFLDLWSEFVMPLYFLSSSSKWPMTLAVYNFFGIYEANWNLVSADVVLTILPVVMVFLIGQRYVMSGITTGAVKG
ncbi:MAG: carbohydrate ABC transporter permease [Acidimicrobiia bacterium]